VSRQIVLVTGANKGIGFDVVRLLAAAHPSWTILLGSRSKDNAEAAVKKLAASNVHPIIIDVNDDASINAAAAEVKRTYGRLDLLFDNAAIASYSASYQIAVDTIRTNVTGVHLVDSAFLPLMPDNTSRIVIVSSEVGTWSHNDAPAALRAKIEATETLQWKDLETLLHQFVESTNPPSHPGAELFPTQKGMFAAYGTSKMFLSAYGRMLNHQLKPRGIPVMLVSPGYCATDLNHNSGPRSAEQGAKSVIMASERSAALSGKLFLDDDEQPVATPMPEIYVKAAAAAAEQAAKAAASK
jgi:NAD(P)-dependent dehydrogenase (short-subunit alcohol dehydrogenase family)